MSIVALLNIDPAGPAFSPIIVFALVLVVWLYFLGAKQPRKTREYVSPNRHLLFGLGILVLLGSYGAPLAPTAGRLFFLHQIQHVFIRLIGPMLIVLAYPLPTLWAGLPRKLRHRLPGRGNQAAGKAAAIIRPRLSVVFILFIVTFYFWQIPLIHNLTLGLPVLLLGAHLSMTGAGILLFAVVLDRRDAPAGAPQGGRLLVLSGIIVSNILLGSITTLKEIVLYDSYDIAGRIYGFSAITDETIGGYIIWVPSSLIIIAAIIFVFNGWNRAEKRRWDSRFDWTGHNAAALEFPETAQELQLKVARANNKMGRTLGISALGMFVIVVVTAVSILAIG